MFEYVSLATATKVVLLTLDFLDRFFQLFSIFFPYSAFILNFSVSTSVLAVFFFHKIKQRKNHKFIQKYLR